jgi:hypothetical protein
VVHRVYGATPEAEQGLGDIPNGSRTVRSPWAVIRKHRTDLLTSDLMRAQVARGLAEDFISQLVSITNGYVMCVLGFQSDTILPHHERSISLQNGAAILPIAHSFGTVIGVKGAPTRVFGDGVVALALMRQ